MRAGRLNETLRPTSENERGGIMRFDGEYAGGARRLSIIAGLVVCAALAVSATPAAADSLVYIKGNMPYISATDGSDAHVVTNDQPFEDKWQLISATASGTVWVAATDGEIGVYAPGQPAQANPPHIAGANNLLDFVVSPDGSSMAYMLLEHSPLDPTELRQNTYFQNFSDGFEGSELSAYWPLYSDPTAFWLGGQAQQLFVQPHTHTQGTIPLPPNVDDVLEIANDANGQITAYRSGGGVLNFASGACPAGETCETTNSALDFVQYDAQNNVTGACYGQSQFPFQKLAINSSGTLVAYEEQDGIHETRIGNLSNCSGFQDLGLVVPGGTSPGFTSSDNRAFPYVSTGTGTGTGTGSAGGSGGGQGSHGGSGTGATDKITGAKAAKSKVKVGKPIVLDVRLSAGAGIVVRVLRHVPASGHGTHHKKAHYVLVGTVKAHGVRGTNAIKLTKIAGHRLKSGSYEAQVSAGGKTHAVRFSLI